MLYEVITVFFEDRLTAFVVNRAHHADIGASSPGSMPISHTLEQEGRVIPPGKLIRRGALDREFLAELVTGNRNPRESEGDFSAQISANRSGVARLLV